MTSNKVKTINEHELFLNPKLIHPFSVSLDSYPAPGQPQHLLHHPPIGLLQGGPKLWRSSKLKCDMKCKIGEPKL